MNDNNDIEVIDILDEDTPALRKVEPVALPKEETIDMPEVNPTMSSTPTPVSMFDPAYDNKPTVEEPKDIVPSLSAMDIPSKPVETNEDAIKKALEAKPTNINDAMLEVEDTLLTNNLKQEIKEEAPEVDKKKAMVIIFILVSLALVIITLPFIAQLLG